MVQKSKAQIIGVLFALVCLASAGAMAEEDRLVTLGGMGISFSLPAEWIQQQLSQEAKDNGLQFAAQNKAGDLTLAVQQRSQRKNENLDTLAARYQQGENVTAKDPVWAADIEFLMSCETDAQNQVTFHVASAMTEGQLIQFILVDSAGEEDREETLRLIVQSVRQLDRGPAPALPMEE